MKKTNKCPYCHSDIPVAKLSPARLKLVKELEEISKKFTDYLEKNKIYSINAKKRWQNHKINQQVI